MFYDSWVLTGFFIANILLILMTIAGYVYQSIQERKTTKGAE
jgi:hypothetical protein